MKTASQTRQQQHAGPALYDAIRNLWNGVESGQVLMGSNQTENMAEAQAMIEAALRKAEVVDPTQKLRETEGVL